MSNYLPCGDYDLISHKNMYYDPYDTGYVKPFVPHKNPWKNDDYGYPWKIDDKDKDKLPWAVPFPEDDKPKPKRKKSEVIEDRVTKEQVEILTNQLNDVIETMEELKRVIEKQRIKISELERKCQ